jgi:chromate transporter
MKLKEKIKLWSDIYFTFLKLGSISFGGGYAIVSLMEREVVEEKKWVDKETIVDIFAVAQSLPGAIALNSSAFVGYAIAGIPGSVIALVGNLTSPVIIIMILSMIFSKIRDLPAIEAAFKGIYPAIVALIAYAGYKIGKTAIKDVTGFGLMLAALLISVVFRVPPIPLIIAGAVLGIILTASKTRISCRDENTKGRDE